MIRLYRTPFSTNVERVVLALDHKGLETESVVIDYPDRTEVELTTGQGLVPAIDDAGTVVVDSMAIIEYLEETYPEPPLYPRDQGERARMEKFITWFNEVWRLWPDQIEDELERPEPLLARVAEFGAMIATELDHFEAMLSPGPYLFGDRFSAADCAAFPFLKYAQIRDPEDRELFHLILEQYQPLGDDHPRIAEWISRVDDLPGTVR